MKHLIIFATGNKGKIREIRDIITDPYTEVLSMREAGVEAVGEFPLHLRLVDALSRARGLQGADAFDLRASGEDQGGVSAFPDRELPPAARGGRLLTNEMYAGSDTVINAADFRARAVDACAPALRLTPAQTIASIGQRTVGATARVAQIAGSISNATRRTSPGTEPPT